MARSESRSIFKDWRQWYNLRSAAQGNMETPHIHVPFHGAGWSVDEAEALI